MTDTANYGSGNIVIFESDDQQIQVRLQSEFLY